MIIMMQPAVNSIATNPHFRHFKRRMLSSPISINLELTSGCNIKCRHCYNFYRDDSNSTLDRLSLAKMDRLIDMIVRDEVYHVVLTGGEPMMVFKVLEHSLRRLHEKGISTSVNSNLMLATPEKAQRLRAAGLDHVLTSLNSHNPEVNDYMTAKEGNFVKIVEGIKNTVAANTRVSVNMIVSEPNKDDVYETAKLCAELGVQKIFGTRLVPAEYHKNPEATDLNLNNATALKALDDLLRAKQDFGIQVGTLISYPLCMLGDLEKYHDFVGRGCPAQRGNRMVINADGQTHACTHESRPYGNVLEVGIKGAFQKMRAWHDGSYLYKVCGDCKYINMCGSGCSAAADAYYGALDAKDPLFAGYEHITTGYKVTIPKEIIRAVDSGAAFVVPPVIRFRNEGDFYTLNVRWANTFNIETDLAQFLIAKKTSGDSFTVADVPFPDARKLLTELIFKQALIPQDTALRNFLAVDGTLGLGVDPADIPDEGYASALELVSS